MKKEKPFVINKEVALKEALEKREEFLKKHPALQSYQKEIDEMLSECPNPKERLELLTILLRAKVDEMQELMEKLWKLGEY